MREEELNDTDVRQHLTEWVRPAVEAAIPDVGGIRRRIWRRRVRGTFAGLVSMAIVVGIGLGVNASLPGGKAGGLHPTTGVPSKAPSTAALWNVKVPGWDTAAWTPAGAPVNTLADARYALLYGDAGPDVVVRNLFTGQRIATIRPPARGTFQGASAAADDATFAFIFRNSTGTNDIYELRLGTEGKPGPLVLLGSVTGSVQGLALSPDGRMLAVSIANPAAAVNTQLIQVIVLANGATRTWGAYGTASGLSWTGDDRTLGFYWEPGSNPAAGTAESGFSELNISGPSDSLVVGSRMVLPAGFGENVSTESPYILSPDGASVITDVFTAYGIASDGSVPTAGYIAEFSARTGKQLRAVSSPVTVPAQAFGLGCSLLWNNASASTVVSRCVATSFGPPSKAPEEKVSLYQNGRISTTMLYIPDGVLVVW
jgi:hypothetical protein